MGLGLERDTHVGPNSTPTLVDLVDSDLECVSTRQNDGEIKSGDYLSLMERLSASPGRNEEIQYLCSYSGLKGARSRARSVG
jgi:hypothetical protein